jgi:hypothetical protein
MVSCPLRVPIYAVINFNCGIFIRELDFLEFCCTLEVIKKIIYMGIISYVTDHDTGDHYM